MESCQKNLTGAHRNKSESGRKIESGAERAIWPGGAPTRGQEKEAEPAATDPHSGVLQARHGKIGQHKLR
jgi:hypothetical protein